MLLGSASEMGIARLVPVRFDGLPTNYPYTLMVPQNVTEQVLLDRLQELGGRVHRPYAANGVSQTADGAVTLDNGDTIKAQYVVAADGMNSTIRDLAGLGHNGNDALSLSFTLMTSRWRAVCRPTRSCCSSPNPGCWSWRRFPDGSFRLVAEVDDAPQEPDVAYAQQLLNTRGPRRTTVTVTEVIWGSRFRIHERVADQYRAGRVVLAGDAAHTHSPAGGQGMNLGLRDAVTLGDALSIALREGREDASTNTRPAVAPKRPMWSHWPTGSRDWLLRRRRFARCAMWLSASLHLCRPSAAAWPSNSPPSATAEAVSEVTGSLKR